MEKMARFEKEARKQFSRNHFPIAVKKSTNVHILFSLSFCGRVFRYFPSTETVAAAAAAADLIILVVRRDYWIQGVHTFCSIQTSINNLLNAYPSASLVGLSKAGHR
jgi:hypothetical protein